MSVDRPFANGTEGADWMDLWCGFCVRDHGMHADTGDGGCEIALKAIIAEPVDEWTMAPEGWRHIPALMICSEFAPCPSCGDGGETAVELRRKAAEAVAS